MGRYAVYVHMGATAISVFIELYWRLHVATAAPRAWENAKEFMLQWLQLVNMHDL